MNRLVPVVLAVVALSVRPPPRRPVLLLPNAGFEEVAGAVSSHSEWIEASEEQAASGTRSLKIADPSDEGARIYATAVPITAPGARARVYFPFPAAPRRLP